MKKKYSRNVGEIHFGKRIGFTIKRLRKAAGISVAQLERTTGISRSILRRLEDGLVYNPQLNVLYMIAHSLRLSLEDVLKESKVI